MFDSNTQSNKNEVPLEEQDLQGRIETLSNIVSNLEDTIKELNLIIDNHEANKSNYQKLLDDIANLDSEIRERKSIILSLSEEQNNLKNENSILIKKNEDLKIQNDLKDKYILDIETYKKASISAGADLQVIQTRNDNANKMYGQNIKSIKDKITELHSQIGSVVLNLK